MTTIKIPYRLLCALFLGCALLLPLAAETERPAEWALPVAKKGLPNLFKVSDDLYRGAQPTAEGMKELKKMGIKTIINLRSFHSDRDKIGDNAFNYVHIYMKAWHPEDEETVRFLKEVTNRSNLPAFLHCMHGADRTGAMVAVYRMAVMGWSREKAIRELKEGGFGYHRMWERYLIPYLEKIDIDAMKKKAGL